LAFEVLCTIGALQQCSHGINYSLFKKRIVDIRIRLPLRRRLVYVRAAGPLTVTILSIAISNIFHLYKAPHNIKTVGVVPAVSEPTQLGPPTQADTLLVAKY